MSVVVEELAEEAGQAAAVEPQNALPFRPETFFLGRTEGGGVIRDPLGRIVRRCRITTDGSFSASQGALRFDEVFTYDDGEVDVWRWVMQAARDGRYVAAEAKAGGGIAGERRGADYVLSFRRPMARARGAFSPHYRTCFTLLTPDMALKRAEATLFAAPLGVLTAVHRRIG